MASSVWSWVPTEVLIKAWEMEVGAQSVGSPSVGERGKMSSSSFCQTAKEASLSLAGGGANELSRIFFSPLLDFLLLGLGVCQDGAYRAADGCHCE